jgi:hypothetical protein
VVWHDDLSLARWVRPTHVRHCTADFLLPTVGEIVNDSSSTADIVSFARDKLGFAVEPSQLQFLTSRAKRGIVNCCRQWGKSTVMSIKAIHRALSVPGCLVLVAAPTERQSGLFLSKIESLAYPLGLRLHGDGYNKLSVQFPNGSRVVGLPGVDANIRGFSAVSMLIIDEASRVPDAMYKALRPMLAVGDGDLWLLSTPNGRLGFFYEEFEFGGDRWERIQVDVSACVDRISTAFLEDEQASMGAAWVRQEYFCEFVDSGGTVFAREIVEAAVDDEIEALVFG